MGFELSALHCDQVLPPRGNEDASGSLSASSHPFEQKKLILFTAQWTQSQLSIRSYLASFLGNSMAVDDCIQEVALVAWNKGPWGAGQPAFLGYCLGCAKRVALAARRRQTDGRLEFLSPEAAEILSNAVTVQEAGNPHAPTERIAALRECLGRMKPEQRDLLEARYTSGDKGNLRDQSKRNGKSMDAIYKKLERLREVLRQCVNRRLDG